jgi:hypothetical protein
MVADPIIIIPQVQGFTELLCLKRKRSYNLVLFKKLTSQGEFLFNATLSGFYIAHN